jgi:hypothetical protein
MVTIPKQAISHRPALESTVKQLTINFLNRSYDENVEHLKFLVSLEKNISYNSKTLEQKYNMIAYNEPKPAAPPKDESKKSGVRIYSLFTLLV